MISSLPLFSVFSSGNCLVPLCSVPLLLFACWKWPFSILYLINPCLSQNQTWCPLSFGCVRCPFLYPQCPALFSLIALILIIYCENIVVIFFSVSLLDAEHLKARNPFSSFSVSPVSAWSRTWYLQALLN